jgi:hypothetical protein
MKDFWRKFKKFNNWTFKEKKVFLKALWNMTLMKTALKLLSFSRFKILFAKSTRKTSSKLSIVEYVLAINRASLVAPNSFSCLPQALAFKKEFINTKLIIGIRPSNKDTLDAHAWVEKDNEILIGDFPNFEYIPLWIWE